MMKLYIILHVISIDINNMQTYCYNINGYCIRHRVRVPVKKAVVCMQIILFAKYCKNIIFIHIFRGPSAKFLVLNVHTGGELKMSGNCLKGSRPLLSFDDSFDKQPQFQLLKELLSQTFCTPNHHPRSQPFFDHVINFSLHDNRIWWRNYQIVDEQTAKLEEIGKNEILINCKRKLFLSILKIFKTR